MPSYDFKCNSCHTTFTLTYKSFTAYASAADHPCPECNAVDTARAIGRVAVAKGDQARLDTLADLSSLAGIDESDPQAVGKFMKKMGQELGSDVSGPIDAKLDELKK